MGVSLPKRITVAPDTLFQELSGESVLLNLQSEQYYSLDDIGTRMWQLLAEREDTVSVMGQLLDEYEVDETTLRKDLAELIAKLAEEGLITVED
jgi:hypothetical protein